MESVSNWGHLQPETVIPEIPSQNIPKIPEEFFYGFQNIYLAESGLCCIMWDLLVRAQDL